MTNTPDRILEQLQAEFGLTDAQLAALPTLSEIDLEPQSDSHLIEHANLTPFTYHPYRLFIGESNKDAFHVYLHRTNRSKQYTIEITSVDVDEGSHYEPLDATYYGSVKNLAYPFNTFLGTGRFVAVVKWYYLLGLKMGMFDEDVGWALSASWRKELQGACGDLIEEMENEKREEHVEEKQAGTLFRANVETTKVTAEAGEQTRHSLPRERSAPVTGFDGHRDPGDHDPERLRHQETRPRRKMPSQRAYLPDREAAETQPNPPPPTTKTRGDRRREDGGPVGTKGAPRVDKRPIRNSTNAEIEAEVSLEAEYTKLYRKREAIEARMDAIQQELDEEKYWALVKRLQSP